ncbi:hypothetical protein ACFT8P_28300 [Streptomyces sp. NPDC057101]|uniref:hypothetical protein n=1 Tax=Streptomyces sp. NPDC057101 TaxID=3346020 RepID=UPI00362898E1
MLYSIDAIVGPVRAAELVNDYRRRLRDEDLLSDRAALAMACTAYAYANVYSLVAVGQLWQAYEKDLDGRDLRVAIAEVFQDEASGHCATARTRSGILERVPLDRLAADYFLYAWPDCLPEEPV